MRKALSLLGATGSIGQSTLTIVAQFPELFTVSALAAHTRVELLADQIKRFRPQLAVVADKVHARRLEELLPGGLPTEVLYGEDGYQMAAALEGVDMVVGAMVGAAGLKPTLAAIAAGKDIALANKETLVMAGEVVMGQVAAKGVRLLPVDSEHSAIFQSLVGHRREDLAKVLLTASGGPFRTRRAESFDTIQPADALKHPNWSMGSKITIDSATLMNKGLEVIEAMWLFGVTAEQIEVVVHPESIVHSMVAYRDGSVIGQMGVPDMKGAIAYALAYPERLILEQPLPDFTGIGALTFETPDIGRFPCLRLAFDAVSTGGTMTAVLNAANEMAVTAFMNEQIGFTQIPRVIEAVMAAHAVRYHADIDDIIAADGWAREEAARLVAQL
ncbi:MAG: 1-deoxy-D-xylulose-5-phosphate reductoisomerase [Desulfosarcinaceae bacterium]|nr:1-deoxy-D-xylulose-5-phosphate reductoisomerase [Desulfosarcinaceae bacterium]